MFFSNTSLGVIWRKPLPAYASMVQWTLIVTVTHTHTHPFSGPMSGTTRVSRYQEGKTNLDFTESRDSEWQWHQLGRMQVCTSLQPDNHASTSPLSFLQAGCRSCRPTNSVKALKAIMAMIITVNSVTMVYCVLRMCCARRRPYWTAVDWRTLQGLSEPWSPQASSSDSPPSSVYN